MCHHDREKLATYELEQTHEPAAEELDDESDDPEVEKEPAVADD